MILFHSFQWSRDPRGPFWHDVLKGPSSMHTVTSNKKEHQENSCLVYVALMFCVARFESYINHSLNSQNSSTANDKLLFSDFIVLVRAKLTTPIWKRTNKWAGRLSLLLFHSVWVHLSLWKDVGCKGKLPPSLESSHLYKRNVRLVHISNNYIKHLF